MEAARQEFRNKMTQYNLALAKMAGVAERLKAQVNGKADRARRTSSAASSPTTAPATWSWPASLARELQELKADLDRRLAAS